jgi:RNA polymerase sigma-70 factor, ECF subfamily
MSKNLDVTLEKIRQRDDAAISQLVSTHHQNLRGFVAALYADIDAVDDIAQEVFLRAIQRLDRVENLEDFPRFLRGIARNVVREQVRKQAQLNERYVEFVDQVFAEEETEHSDSPFRDPGLSEALRGCLGKLAPKARQMLVLRYREELHANEIGAELGMKGGAVRTSLLRVRESLLKCLRGSAPRELKEAGL